MMDFNKVGLTSSFGSAPKLLISRLAEGRTFCTQLMYVQFILVD